MKMCVMWDGLSHHYLKSTFSDQIDLVWSALLGFSKNCQKCWFLAIFIDFLHNRSSDLHEILGVGVSPHYLKTSFSHQIDLVRSPLLDFTKNCQKCWFMALFSNFLHNWSSDLHEIMWAESPKGSHCYGAIGPIAGGPQGPPALHRS